MRHPLFATLVLTGSALVGCGTTHGVSLLDVPPDGSLTVDASQGPDVGVDAGSDAPSTLADVGVDAGSPAFCEPGWPTTKGYFSACTDAAGTVLFPEEGERCVTRYLCSWFDVDGEIDPRRLDLNLCCVLRPDDAERP